MHLTGLLALMVAMTTAYPTYQPRIPNGWHVMDPCNPGNSWHGVGHFEARGTGALNPFGVDFAANNHVWDATLCLKDSDGDGATNGAELGDVACMWAVGGPVVAGNTTGHPGICEPVDSAKCTQLQGSLYQC